MNLQQAEFIDRTRCINCQSTKLSEVARGNFADQPLAGFIASDPWGENPAPFLESAYWILSRCEDCGQMFHSHVLNEEWNERRFSKWMSAAAIHEFESRLGPAVVRRFDTAVSHVTHILRIQKLTKTCRSKDDAVRILDFGCGFGDFIEACIHFGFDACGIDRSAGRRADASMPIFSSFAELDQSKKFHTITAFEVMEHLDNPSDVLAQLATFLVDDGILVLETPDCSGVHDIKSLYEFRKIDPLEHINAFTHHTLKSLAERRGFVCIDRGPGYVTADTKRAGKRFARHLLRRDGKSTQLYFRKKVH
jgi:2-polyprenyl-3-methyl-5-hydroxy-6-metoxy-1,4-benzoquinol methylase